MLHRQLRTALEEIFGVEYIAEALANAELAQVTIYDSPDTFKKTVLGFQRLNFRDEQTQYAMDLERDFGFALICSLLDTSTRSRSPSESRSASTGASSRCRPAQRESHSVPMVSAGWRLLRHSASHRQHRHDRSCPALLHHGSCT